MALLEIAYRISTIDKKTKTSKKGKTEEKKGCMTKCTAQTLRRWLWGLLIFVIVLGIFDTIIAVTQDDQSSIFVTVTVRVVYELNSVIFFAITIGLIASTVIVA